MAEKCRLRHQILCSAVLSVFVRQATCQGFFAELSSPPSSCRSLFSLFLCRVRGARAKHGAERPAHRVPARLATARAPVLGLQTAACKTESGTCSHVCALFWCVRLRHAAIKTRTQQLMHQSVSMNVATRDSFHQRCAQCLASTVQPARHQVRVPAHSPLHRLTQTAL